MKTYTFAFDKETRNYYKFVEQHPSGGICTRDNAEVNCGNPLYLPKTNFTFPPKNGIRLSIEAVPLEEEASK